ncbi:MAG TPA: hypothetical protein VGR20_23370 [Acidimicrobiia bacterium]|nr:hypothetical protein [Acidimicrobiia bacterium]
MPLIPLRSGRAARVAVALVLVAFGLVGEQGVIPARAAGDPVLLAAGDVGNCSTIFHGDEGTADILKRDPGAPVAMLGDAAYDLNRPGSGTDLAALQDCYGPSWGQPDIKSRTHPTTGNHEYVDPDGTNPGASAYFDYFNGAGVNDGPAGPRPLGYYSYDVGSWHVVVLNAHCNPSQKGLKSPLDGCGPDSTMGKWLSADLAAHPSVCTLAYWHEPRFFSFTMAGQNPPVGNTTPDSDATMNSMWTILQDHGADVVLNGHRHVYERFRKVVAPSGATGPGIPDDEGIREFIVGTGGGPHEHFLRDASDNLIQMDPNSDPAVGGFRNEKSFGVLRLTLHQGSYDWQYVEVGSAPSAPPVDAGSDTCSGGSTGSTTPTTATTGPPPTTTTPPATSGPAPGPAPAARPGYWMVGADGRVFGFGAASAMGDAAPAAGATSADIEPVPGGSGYWVVDSAGAVTPRGSAPKLGSVAPGVLAAGEKVTSLSGTPSGHGYWIFTTRGRVLTFGDATGYGDMSKVALNGPVLDSIPTPSGHGYYMVGSDGGIFAFGDAVFAGSMGGKRLNAPVQSLVPVPPGAAGSARGYWLVAADGGVFAFDAPFRGSMGATRLARPVTGMVPYGDGYLMVGEDGGVFNFSNLAFVGSLGANPPAQPIVSVAAAS